MESKARPGDVWEERDGDLCYIVEEAGSVGEPYYQVLAYYPSTSRRHEDGMNEAELEHYRWSPVRTTRIDSQLAKLLYRQEEVAVTFDIYDFQAAINETVRAIASATGTPLPEPRADLRWVAIDLDGTIAEPIWTPENPTRQIGDPIMRNVRKLDDVVRAGYKVVIHTARGWEHYEAIENWLNFNRIPFDKIVCGKLLALRYIDDRAIHSEEDSWLP